MQEVFFACIFFLNTCTNLFVKYSIHNCHAGGAIKLIVRLFLKDDNFPSLPTSICKIVFRCAFLARKRCPGASCTDFAYMWCLHRQG